MLRNRYFRNQLKALGWMLEVLAGFLLLLVLLSTISNPHYTYHYLGKSYISPEEYVKIAASAKPTTAIKDSLVQDTSGLLFTYNFYSDTFYSFLVLVPRGNSFVDSPAFQGLRGTNWIGILATLVLGIAIIYLISINQRRVIDWGKRLRRGLLKRKYLSLIARGGVGTVVKDLDSLLPGYTTGILGVRSWRVVKGELVSMIQDTAWHKGSIVADTIPDKVNFSGIYAYRLGAPLNHIGEVMGIVELKGKYEHHPDGVVRAESCHILALFTSNVSETFPYYLSVKYEAPVYTSEEASQGYVSWLFSRNGIKAMQYNMEILG